MRFWSGATWWRGTDDLGLGVTFEGPSATRVVQPGDDWRLDIEKPDGSRLWRPVRPASMSTVQPPVDDRLADMLYEHLTGIEPQGPHPALVGGLASEARRLVPTLDTEQEQEFARFVQFLDDGYGFNENSWTAPMEAFVDGFGPQLVVDLGGRVVPLPEMPPVYLAPAPWRSAMWWVTTSVIGPIDDAGHSLGNRLSFDGPMPDDDLMIEGLVYYQTARAMAAWAAWEGDSSARFMQVVMSEVLSGFQPWRERPSIEL
jgi:hypothetical protein